MPEESAQSPRLVLTTNKLFLIAALVVFVLGTFGVPLGSLNMVHLGLALLTASMLA